MRRRYWHSPGWYGVRAGGRYIVLRDVTRHILLFSERNGYGGREVASIGDWQLWVKP